MANRSTPAQKKKLKNKRKYTQKLKNAALNILSPTGIAFLKAAYALPDFEKVNFQGVPDDSTEETIKKVSIYTQKISVTANKDRHILVLPTPGVAYWYCNTDPGQKPAEDTVWTAAKFSDFNTTFGTDEKARDANFTGFRYAGLMSEFVSTDPIQTSSGSITIRKLPVSVTDSIVTLSTGQQVTVKTLVGLSGVQSTSGRVYTEHKVEGGFVINHNTQPNFPFKPIMNNYEKFPMLPEPGIAVPGTQYGSFEGPVLGLGTQEATYYVIGCSNDATLTTSGVFKVWAAMELQPNTNSAMKEFATPSAPSDPAALTVYKAINASFQVAVPARENANFWSKIWKMTEKATGILAGAGVPYVGAINTGMNMAQNLVFG